MLASTKYLHQQNTRVNKMLKKYLRQKNVGASAEESLYCSGPAESAAADFSQTSLIFSLKVLSSPGAVAQWLWACSAWLIYRGTSPRLVVPIRNAKNPQNIGVNKILAAAKISLLFTKLPPSTASDPRPSWRSAASDPSCPREGGGAGAPCHTSLSHGRAKGTRSPGGERGTHRWGIAACEHVVHLVLALSFAFL